MQAIWLLTTGAREAAFRNIKTIAECLADELMNAAKGSSNRCVPVFCSVVVCSMQYHVEVMGELISRGAWGRKGDTAEMQASYSRSAAADMRWGRSSQLATV
jgi:hypothetical protein